MFPAGYNAANTKQTINKKQTNLQLLLNSQY